MHKKYHFNHVFIQNENMKRYHNVIKYEQYQYNVQKYHISSLLGNMNSRVDRICNYTQELHILGIRL